jgi:hypothetical protein
MTAPAIELVDLHKNFGATHSVTPSTTVSADSCYILLAVIALCIHPK